MTNLTYSSQCNSWRPGRSDDKGLSSLPASLYKRKFEEFSMNGGPGFNKKKLITSLWWVSLFSNSTASRNILMGILRIPFLCGLRLAKTILCLRASPGLRIFLLYSLSLLSNIVIWPGSYQDCQIKKTPFQVSLLFGSFLSSQAASSQVLSAFVSLTSVFGMGTGVSSQLLPPYLKVVPSKLYRSITEALGLGRVVKS